MARKRDRAFAGFFAGLFLLTSSALTITVIYTVIQNGKDKTSDGTASTPASSTKPQEAKLENFTPTTQPQTELKAIDTKEGTGEAVKPGDTITADYTGALMSNGVIFDSSSKHGGAATFSLSGVIAGWSQGVPGMKVGGTRRLLIPASLAYGAQSQSGIPANSDLVFDITLQKIGK